MYISSEINSFRKNGGDKQIIKMLKDAGFTAYDYSMLSFGKDKSAVLEREDYKEYAKELRAYADGIGMICNQAHAPCPDFGITRTEEYDKIYFNRISRAIEISGILGAKIIVVHPEVKRSLQGNVDFFSGFSKDAVKAGVKIGVENIHSWTPGDSFVSFAVGSDHNSLKQLLGSLDPELFVACLDIGHAEIDMRGGGSTSAVQMIETLGDRLQAIHLHDNLKWGANDNHAIPFSRSIDFAPIIRAFRKINYKGDITLESCGTVDITPNELLPALARYMAAIANYFKTEIEKTES